MRINFIDHYDSFSNNILNWLEMADFEVERYFFDSIPERIQSSERPLVFSPGPGAPERYQSSLDLIRDQIGKVPILGICLGHQMLGIIAGFEMKESEIVWHGHKREIKILHGAGIFRDVAQSFEVTSYNSLCLRGMQSKGWTISAKNQKDEIEAIENWSNPLCPAVGIQFHPESFLSQDLTGITKVWADTTRRFTNARSPLC